jgi:dihydrofolate reductase
MDVVLIEHVTLDGVMQGPGRPDEDTRGEFELGGWATPRSDEVVGQALGKRMANSAGLLLGRRTYDDLLGHWNRVPDNPFVSLLNAASKYVVTTQTADPPWPNTTFLNGDPAARIRALRSEPGGDLHVMGSGQLVELLVREDLVDGLLLLIHPIVLGTGHRLFEHGVPAASFELVEQEAAPSGVIAATYRRAAGGDAASPGA